MEKFPQEIEFLQKRSTNFLDSLSNLCQESLTLLRNLKKNVTESVVSTL